MKRLWLVLGVLFITLVSVGYFVVDRFWSPGGTAPLAPEVIAGPSTNPTRLELTYIANEGVLITS